VQPEYTRAVVNRLKTVRGHLDGVIRMVEEDAYCIEVMKQLSALQSSLERSNRLVLLNHLETCFTGAVQDGRGVEALAELVDALKFHDGLTGPGIAAALAAEREPVPGVSAFSQGDYSR
jgi:DNA-binding FrmR family transcriptional regulator